MHRNNLIHLIFCSLLLICHSFVFGQTTIRGTVFLDKNTNCVQDAKEKGLANILISNGIDIVKSDKQGNFSISIKKGQSLFPILPAQYQVISAKESTIQNSKFYYFHPDSTFTESTKYQFPLNKIEVPEKFRVGAIGDIQVDNDEELDYAAKSIISELANERNIDMNIILGDLVNDKPNLMGNAKNLLNVIPTNSWVLPGNHDRDFKHEDALNNVFNTYFGADTYAFNYGSIHFIVFNNVYATGKRSYEGRVNEDQIAFLKNDLEHVDKNRTIVICQHIPMISTKNRNEVFQLLEGFNNVLILSGHTHVVSRHFFKNGKIHEIGAGATCGTWWRGEKDSDGIPEALMQCGSPRGYFVIDFNKDQYSFRYKSVGKDADTHMSLTVDSNQIIANIFGGSDSTVVQCQINEGDWVTMKKTRMVDPRVKSIVQNNKAKTFPTAKNTANPLRERNSNHVWTIPYENSKEKKPVMIRIKATDKYGLYVNEQKILFQ